MINSLILLFFVSLVCIGEDFELVCKKNGNGFVRGEGVYVDGDIANLLAVAQPDWKFEKWIVDGAIFTNKNISITVNKNTSFEVFFVRQSGKNTFVSGTVAAWGFIDGRDYVDPQEVIPKDLGNVVSVSAGYFHSVALKTDGKVVAWGKNFGSSLLPVG